MFMVIHGDILKSLQVYITIKNLHNYPIESRVLMVKSQQLPDFPMNRTSIFSGVQTCHGETPPVIIH